MSSQTGRRGAHSSFLARHLSRVALLATGLVVASLPVLSGCGSTDTKRPDLPTVRLLTPAERAVHLESFDQVWSTIQETHWDPAKIGDEWTQKRDELRPKIEVAKTADEVRGVFVALIESLDQSHFHVLPPGVYEEISGEVTDEPEEIVTGDGGSDGSTGSVTTTVSAGETVRVTPPKRSRNPEGSGDHGLDFTVIDSAAIISRVDRGSPGEKAGIELGWLLEAVDGRPVQKIFDRFSGVSTDGELGMMLHFSILRRLKGDEGDSVDLLLRDGAGEAHEATIVLGPPRAKRVKFGNMPPISVEWQLERREEIGYFRLSSFFEPGPVRSAVAEFVDENQDAAGFIIDLRGNPGGIGFMANGLAGLFVEEKGKSLGTMTTRESELNFGIYPQATTYSGPLAVLIDGGSASTSEIMAQGLRDIGRARLFGSTTAGAALPSVFTRLPNGDGFQYAIANYVSAGGETLEGAGASPDEHVEPNRESLLRGIDSVYEAARIWIGKEAAKQPSS